ncbi:MAG: NAD(P)/FAD-dependent oxidoreductase [Chloroflexia bacterium]
MRYVIVGNGVAGTKAAETIRRRDAQGEILVLSSEAFPFYRRPALVEYLVGRTPLEGLIGHPEAFYRAAGIEVRLNTPVVGLDPHAHRLTLAGGETVPYDRLLLAVGAERPKNWLPGSELAGMISLRTVADAEELRQAAGRARRTAVVGEGVTGLEMARAFRLLGLPVAYLLEGARFWENVLSPEASELVEERLRSEGVDVLPGKKVVAFEGSAGRVRAVVTATGEHIPADVVGIAAGLCPPLEWAREAGLDMEKRVRVNDFLLTNLPDVYAAGDAVRMEGEARSFGWLRAWNQGLTAGINMSGGQAPYRRRTVSLSTRAFGLPILVMGETNPRNKFRRIRGDYPLDGIYKELVLDEESRTLIGALMVGEVSEASRVEELVRRQVPYSQVDPELLRRLFDVRYWAGAGAEVLCPVCKFLVQVGEEELRLGRVTCPICGAEFALRASGNRIEVSSSLIVER